MIVNNYVEKYIVLCRYYSVRFTKLQSENLNLCPNPMKHEKNTYYFDSNDFNY